MGGPKARWPKLESAVLAALQNLLGIAEFLDHAKDNELDTALELLWPTAAALRDAVEEVPAWPILEALEHGTAGKVGEVLDEAPARKRRTRIPREHRTRPMSYREAARLMGYGRSKDAAERLIAAVRNGAVAQEPLTRKQHIFDRRDFPPESQSKIGADWP
jgi:hypothetical protein